VVRVNAAVVANTIAIAMVKAVVVKKTATVRMPIAAVVAKKTVNALRLALHAFNTLNLLLSPAAFSWGKR